MSMLLQHVHILFIQYLICLFCAQNEFFWDGHECGEGNHKYNKCKTLIMVVSKIMLAPYCPHMMKRKQLHTTTSMPYNYVFTL
jgi:hypothetical protein